MDVVTMTLPLKNILLKISHGFMAGKAVTGSKNQFLLSLKSVDVRSPTTSEFL